MSIYDKPVRELLHRFVTENGIVPGQAFPKAQVAIWFRGNYPKIKPNTVTAQTILATTNNKTRIYYGAAPRNDLFFQIDSGQLRLYDSATDPQPIYDQTTSADSLDVEAEDAIPEEADADQFAYEADLKNFLSANLNRIESGLKLYDKVEGLSGVEFPAGGRFVDILATDGAGNFVVIELKVSRGYDRVVGQLLRYMGWIEKNLAKENERVRGVIIANSISEDLLLACSRVPSVDLYEYRLAVSLTKVQGESGK